MNNPTVLQWVLCKFWMLYCNKLNRITCKFIKACLGAQIYFLVIKKLYLGFRIVSIYVRVCISSYLWVTQKGCWWSGGHGVSENGHWPSWLVQAARGSSVDPPQTAAPLAADLSPGWSHFLYGLYSTDHTGMHTEKQRKFTYRLTTIFKSMFTCLKSDCKSIWL